MDGATAILLRAECAEFRRPKRLARWPQKGAESNIGSVATTGRMECLGFEPDSSQYWQDVPDSSSGPLRVPVAVAEADARYAPGDRLELRGQFAQVFIDNAAELNDAMTRRIGVNPNIARSLRGFYLESGYRLLSGTRIGDVGGFIRYENFDTQYRMPTDRSRSIRPDEWVIGATYWPDPDVAIKLDYSLIRSQSDVIKAPNSFNVGLGWWF